MAHLADQIGISLDRCNKVMKLMKDNHLISGVELGRYFLHFDDNVTYEKVKEAIKYNSGPFSAEQLKSIIFGTSPLVESVSSF